MDFTFFEASGLVAQIPVIIGFKRWIDMIYVLNDGAFFSFSDVPAFGHFQTQNLLSLCMRTTFRPTFSGKLLHS